MQLRCTRLAWIWRGQLWKSERQWTHICTDAKVFIDTVFISNESQAIKDLETSIKEEPDFDQAKVDQIKAAIADGNFAIDDEALADNIMQFEDILG